MPPAAEDTICHVTGCERPSEYACDSCGKSCCAEHCRTVVVERRDYRVSAARRQEPLARVASHMESYMLCGRCSTKPVSSNASKLRNTSI